MEWIEKMVFWLYDTLGLFLPGVLTVILINSQLQREVKVDLFHLKLPKYNEICFFLILIMLFYILGNILKISSQLFYDILEVVFDGFILKFINLTKNKEDSVGVKFFKDYMKHVFSFKVEKYFINSEYMISEVEKKVYIGESAGNVRDKGIKEKWYNIYKLGKRFEENEGIKSLSSIFLAKYTLYRSLSFIFFINFIYFLINKDYLKDFRNNGIIIYIILFISWLTFHMKYKKYYVLCGNEMLTALYYKLILKAEEKNEITIC